MALLDFIELSDDEEIVVSKKDDEGDLRSGDETAEESHNDFTYGHPGQHPTTTLLDGQAVFVAEGEGEATESGNADEATPSSSVMEKGSVGTAASQNCPPAAVSFPHPTSISVKALTFEDFDANLLRVKVKRHRKLFHTDTPSRSPRLEDKNKGRRKSVEELAVDLKRSRMLEEQNTSAASQNCSHTPAAVTFPIPSPTSISVEALTFEASDANLRTVEVKRRKKLVHTDERWRSPRLEEKNKGRRKSVEELAVDLKRSRMLEEQNTSAVSQNYSHTAAAVTFPIRSPTSISVKALTFEASDANLRRVEVKRRKKLVHTDERWRSPRLEDKNKGRRKSVEELAVDLKRSQMLEEQNTSARSQKKNKLSLCTRCRMCKEPLY